MKRDLPLDFGFQADSHDEPPRSLLASRAFWVGGVLSLLVWVLGIWIATSA